MDVETLIKENRDIKENSLRAYIIALTKLNGNKKPENLEFLNNKKEIMENIKDLALTTKKNRLTAILVALGALGDKEKLLEEYKKELDTLNEEYFQEIKKNIKTDKQGKNWVKMKELKRTMNKYKKEIDERNILKKENISFKELMILQNYLITALYILLPPIRLDFAPMEIITNKDQIKPDKNYLLVKSRNNKEFIIQEFKNVKTHGIQNIKVPKMLNSILNLWLKYKPDDNIFLYNNRKGMMSSNGLGKAITKAFKPTGKNITLGLLRKIYISENIDLGAIKKAEKLAENMLHSPKVQQTIYYKKDE